MRAASPSGPGYFNTVKERKGKGKEMEAKVTLSADSGHHWRNSWPFFSCPTTERPSSAVKTPQNYSCRFGRADWNQSGSRSLPSAESALNLSIKHLGSLCVLAALGVCSLGSFWSHFGINLGSLGFSCGGERLNVKIKHLLHFSASLLLCFFVVILARARLAVSCSRLFGDDSRLAK